MAITLRVHDGGGSDPWPHWERALAGTLEEALEEALTEARACPDYGPGDEITILAFDESETIVESLVGQVWAEQESGQ